LAAEVKVILFKSQFYCILCVCQFK